ncbi:9f3ec32a-c96e-4cd3-bfce-5aa9c2885b60 [Thermothielavioides terrestris]|uniref:9f3ec32a-c96e-4cd3-bfce-5aa9c2885b60 n=1 Tax=Thermothielavioides terrestris TaxID=2587410 RepID=A0A3S4EY72_9PEZI|nr:9f3ec32a-c96e-4cd3-bfce-5aa9c2885b60 [Thermothielavioides terrestris]
MSSTPSSDTASSLSASSSFVITDVPRSASSGRDPGDDDEEDVDSLPSISSSILDSEADSSSDAQREWEASLEQLQLLLTMVIMPFAGKFLGRKFAYWSWARYMEWMHNVEIRWTSKRTFNAAGAAEAASSL